jgi:3D (Asp-Asp-Asp) domain-containing protein
MPKALPLPLPPRRETSVGPSLRLSPAAGRATTIAGAAMLVAFLAACAPLRPPQAPVDPRSTEATPRPESAAIAEDVRSDESEPPTSGGVPESVEPEPQVLVVQASAYNSRRGQTDATPSIAAWGDQLRPGMKVIAVSKDLLELGLARGQRVRIRGLEGEYVVLDRMPSRWRQKIDIYMGNDVRAALQWGIREVEIEWIPEEAPGE